MAGISGSSMSRCVSRWLTMVASLTLGSLTGTTVHGACGDWLEGHAVEQHATATDTDAAGLPPPRGCRGPSCRGLPEFPAGPVGEPLAPVEREHDAVLARGFAPVDPRQDGMIPADSPRFSSAESERPHRPPRQG